VFIILFSFYAKFNGEEMEQTEGYMVEEVIEPEDVIPEETEESPTIEETDEVVAVMDEVIIEMYDGKFYPDEITISPGTTVIWVNRDPLPHKLVAYDRIFYSPRLQPEGKYSFTFTNEGTHTYFDAVFPKAGKGKITVKEEPLPITGGVVGIGSEREGSGKFALLILLFVIMIFGLSHGMYNHY